MDIDDLLRLAGITSRSPASPATIAAAENSLGVVFPDDYRTLLLRSNGLEGFVSPDSFYLALHPVEFVSEHQYEPNLIPDLVVIGSDGGGEAFGFIPRQEGGDTSACAASESATGDGAIEGRLR